MRHFIIAIAFLCIILPGTSKAGIFDTTYCTTNITNCSEDDHLYVCTYNGDSCWDLIADYEQVSFASASGATDVDENSGDVDCTNDDSCYLRILFSSDDDLSWTCYDFDDEGSVSCEYACADQTNGLQSGSDEYCCTDDYLCSTSCD